MSTPNSPVNSPVNPSPLLDEEEILEKLETVDIASKANIDEGEADLGFSLDKEDLEESLADYRSSFLGKILTHKPVNLTGLRSTMSSDRAKPEGLCIDEVEKKIYQFIFSNEADMEK